MLDMKASYTTIRNTVGVYQRGNKVLTITGSQRLEYTQFLLAKSIEFARIDTCIDSILLDADAHPVGTAVAMIREDTIELVVEAPPTWFDHAVEIQQRYDIQVDYSTAIAIQVEGPHSWKVAATLVADREISDILLNECVDAELNGEAIYLARAGTTAEYGYLIISSSRTTLDNLVECAESLGGGLIDPTVLNRIHAETNYPIIPEQFQGTSIFECGLPWMASVTRTDAFLGSEKLELKPPSRRTVAAIFSGHDCPPMGTAVFVDGDSVGTLLVSTDRAGQEDGLGLLLMDDPYGVPGVGVEIAGTLGVTVSRPVVAPLSWSIGIGVEE